jgi:hypothetical protein
MAISDKDREELVDLLYERLAGVFSLSVAAELAEAVIGEGWAPRPKVDLWEIVDRLDCACAGALLDEDSAIDYLRECGIEVGE